MISVQSLIDSKVLDQDNKEMGTVKNLMLDLRTGKLVRADIALGRGGFLGIKAGEQRISVPWEQVSVKRHEGSLVVVMNQQAVETIRTDKTKQAAGRTNQQQERSSAAKSTPTPATQPPASQSKQQATAAGKNPQVTASTDEIRKAEEALQAKGLNPGPIDGKIDSQTQEALREFQKQNNLPVTGSLDEQTAEKLGVKLGGGNGSSAQEQAGKKTAPPENKTEGSQTK
jgi:sporulation protein YlmC with PRC-barrel domain